MFDAIAQGLSVMVQPIPLMFLFLGVVIGLTLSTIPGLSGSVGLAVLLSMIWGMPPEIALPLMIGLMSATNTGDVIPAILFGTPGDGSATAAIMDGYPLAKRGMAARALGATFLGSALSGIIGVILLALSIPVAWILLRQFLSPEFFMLCMLGVVMVGGLSGRVPIKGIFAGGLGLLISTSGVAPSVGHYRFTFGQAYLADGIPLLVMAIGIIAMPEIADLFIKGTKVATVETAAMGEGILRGYKDALQNWLLVVRASLIGVWIGFTPGIGGAAANWIAYSHAVQCYSGRPKRDKHGNMVDGYEGKFGQGDMRGLIAAATPDNAAKGGQLIPTLVFGIPGGGSMALLLTGMIIIGITPGQAMMDPNQNLYLTFVIIFSLAMGNIISTLLCTLLIRPWSRLVLINAHYLIPFILMFMLFGAFQATSDWGDWVALLSIGVLGWVMKRLGWPRPPLFIGFVLGGLADKYLWLSVVIFGVSWLWRPWVLVVFAASALFLWFTVRSARRQAKVPAGGRSTMEESAVKEMPQAVGAGPKWSFKTETIFTLLMLAVAIIGFQQATTYPFGSGIYPMVISLILIGLAAGQVVVELRQKELVKETMDITLEVTQKGKEAMTRAKRWAIWIAGIYLASWLVGYLYTITAFFFLFLWLEGHFRWRKIFLLTGICAVLAFWVLTGILEMDWPRGLLHEWLAQR